MLLHFKFEARPTRTGRAPRLIDQCDKGLAAGPGGPARWCDRRSALRSRGSRRGAAAQAGLLQGEPRLV